METNLIGLKSSEDLVIKLKAVVWLTLKVHSNANKVQEDLPIRFENLRQSRSHEVGRRFCT